MKLFVTHLDSSTNRVLGREGLHGQKDLINVVRVIDIVNSPRRVKAATGNGDVVHWSHSVRRVKKDENHKESEKKADEARRSIKENQRSKRIRKTSTWDNKTRKEERALEVLRTCPERQLKVEEMAKIS